MSFPNTRIAPVNSWGTLKVTTAATGTNYAAMPDKAARVVTLCNASGTAIHIRKAGGTEDPYVLADGGAEVFPVLGNAKEIEIKRVDDSDTQVTLTAHYDD